MKKKFKAQRIMVKVYFYIQNSYTIDYSMERPSALSGITFNENVGDLSCQNIGSFIKRCTVSRSHFEGKKMDIISQNIVII